MAKILADINEVCADALKELATEPTLSIPVPLRCVGRIADLLSPNQEQDQEMGAFLAYLKLIMRQKNEEIGSDTNAYLSGLAIDLRIVCAGTLPVSKSERKRAIDICTAVQDAINAMERSVA